MAMRMPNSRVRWLTEGNRADISYVHATLPNGRIVPVQPDLDNLIPLWARKRALVMWAQREGVFGRGIGLLNESNWSTL